jgi:hypothetical protein
MPWFKVDDGLTMKAETTRIPRSLRTSAIGLLTLAGSWSARELTDGHIPAHMLDELCGAQSDAEWLVTAGFWTAVNDGWQFVEWAPDQPLREVVLAERAKRAEKMRGWRARNRPSNPVTDFDTDSDGDPVTDASVTHAPSQSRPDPDQSVVPIVQNRAPEYEDEDEFDRFWLLWPRKQAKADARKAYHAARKKGATAKAIFDGAQAYALLNIGNDKSFLKMPAGWIRDERWNDEQIEQGQHSPTQTERNLQVVRQYAIAGRTLLASNVLDPSETCPLHPGYPDTIALPCEACKRSASLPEGADF